MSVGAASGFVLAASQAAPAGASAYTPGDLFISVGNGKVEERTPSGALVQTLNSGATTRNNTGSTFDKNGNFYVTEFSANQVSKFDANGNFVGTFGSGYNADPESILFDAAGNAYVGQADGSTAILKFSPTGAPLGTFTPALDARGTDWIDLEANGCVMQYTGEGTRVKRFNVCTNTQMTDFASGLPGSAAYAHRTLPDGGSLVADTEFVVRLNSAGAQVQTYTPAEAFRSLFALNLDPDGTSFWTADIGGTGLVVRFNIATGAELAHFSLRRFLGEDPAGISVLGERSAVPKITLAPVSATNPVGTNHTLTATASDEGAPAVGKTVTFKVVSGPNMGLTGTGTTNASGDATFTYSSSMQGTDTIRASFVAVSGQTVTSNNATKTWGPGGNRPATCVVTALRPGPPAQQDVTVKDPDGIHAIFNIHIDNGTVAPPVFTDGTPGPVVLTATKTDQSKRTFWEFDVTDSKGVTKHCV